jgi:hypothetical protein
MSNENKLNINPVLVSPIQNKEKFPKSSEITGRSTNNETRKQPFRSENNFSTFLINSERNTINSKTSLNLHKNSAGINNNNFIKDKNFYEIKKDFFEKDNTLSNINSTNKNLKHNKFSHSKLSLINPKSIGQNSNIHSMNNLPFIAEDSKSQIKNNNPKDTLTSSSSKLLSRGIY